ncbi:L-threonine O-3-phosphate decarboxylase [Chlorobium phaeobacteroides DSM 266]|uniref:threonine-phosphate decarboxylase n=1 Tax=Chlorobium phaeobacteroides (strain DSM 266 / SMG 266 / 2430) TaxID=290317 RepID=A1BFI1_CHLPD|nr:L-threonine O-3-phosphate decarboxylase [Chlorobium phaeobacteroides DSM 266]
MTMKSIYYHEHGGTPERRFAVNPEELLDFSVNISPLFPPLENRLLDTYALDRYPSVDGRGIIDFYAGRFQLHRSTILALNGATEGIYLLPRALGFRRMMVLSPTFYEYERAGRLAGAAIGFIRLTPDNGGFLLPRLEELAAMLEDADAFFAANPNNPTGTVVPPEIILALASRFPDKWFLVDEAFLQYSTNYHDTTLMNMVTAMKNIVVIQSLTKFYALPGLRLGALIAHPEVITRLLEYKEPWSVNTIAETVARELLACRAYETAVCDLVLSERGRITQALSDNRAIKLAGGAANFFLARWQGSANLDDLLNALLQQGIYVRDCRNFAGLEENYFRFAIRTPEENTRLLDVFQHLTEQSVDLSVS